MRTPQKPIKSRFSAASTAADILRDIDLTGKNAIVTGGYSGIGRQAAIALANAGAHVTVPARDLARARKALEGIENVEIEKLDLLDPKSIDTFAEEYLATKRPLHILINCAAIMASPLMRDSRGYESQFSTNHLGHFQLTTLLKPALVAAHGARVVSVSSLGHRYSPVHFDDPNYERREYTPWLGYGQAKTANILFAIELDRRGQSDDVRAFAVHPGMIIDTGLGKYLPSDFTKNAGIIDENGKPIIDPSRNMKTPEQGAAPLIWFAASPELDGMGGVYGENCNISDVKDIGQSGDPNAPRPTGGVTDYAIAPEAAKKLWTLSEQLVFGGKSVW